MHPVEAAQRLSKACAALTFQPPVAWTYDPLDYAWDGHRQYAERFGDAPKPVLAVGMNPGPWGMGQTGVPFGDITAVRDWMGIEHAEVRQPPNVRDERPVHGWETPRGEVSGTRIYRALREAFGSLAAAYEHLYVANYCPLLFFDEDAKNVTPDKLRKADREALFEPCDEHVAALIDHFGTETIVAVGKFAERRAKAVVKAAGVDVDVVGLLHPSPASPLANKEGGAHWRAAFTEAMGQAALEPKPLMGPWP